MASSGKAPWPGKWSSDGRSLGRDAPKLYDSKEAAFRAAKQDARVPSDCRPISKTEESYNGFPGKFITRFDFNMGGGKIFTVSDHYEGHKFSDGSKDLRPHVHVRPGTESHGYIPTAYEHYFYKK